MSQNVLVGTNGQTQTALYSNGSPVTYEETNVNGFGVRVTVARQYKNWFTQAFASAGDDEGFFKSGHAVVVSVSNPVKSPGPSTFSFGLMANGSYNTDIDLMFDRIFALPFDSAVAGGSAYGGITQPYVYLILQHEVDRGNINGANKLPNGSTTADYVAAWQLLWTRCGLRAAAAGKPRTRVRFCWDITGYQITRSDPYWPGAQYVDVIGVDPYTGSTGSPVSFASMNSSIWPYVRAKNKPMAYCETNWIHDTADSAAGQSWWIDAAAQINALDIKVEFVSIWNAGTNTHGTTYYQYSFNKVAGADTGGHAFPLIHAGIASFISALGNNAIRVAAGQALPAAPTGLSVTSATNGLSTAASWSANTGGDNVTSWNLYRASGFVTQGAVKVGTVVTATPRTFTYSGLTAGQNYTFWVSAVNSAGEGPLSDPFQLATSVPGPTNHSPNITSATAVVDPVNPQTVHFVAVASDPDSNPITYTWAVSNGAGTVVDTFTGATVDRTYQTAGAYTWGLSVADNGTPPLSTPASGSFAITLNPAITPLNGWDLSNFMPNQFVELIGKGLIPIFGDLDTKVGALTSAHGDVADLLGGVGQTFDPALAGASSTYTATVSTNLWAKLKCRAGSIVSLNTYTTQAQIGTGAVVAFCDVGGNVLTVDGTQASSLAIFSGTNVDAWLTATAGDTTYTLDTSISGLTPGQIITVEIFWPAAGITQYPKFLASATPSAVAKVFGNSASPRWGNATVAQSGIGSPVPFGSYVACALPYFGIA